MTTAKGRGGRVTDLDAFETEVAERLAEAGLASLSGWHQERPGEHLPATYRALRSCALCGACEPSGGYRSTCRGVARITLREEST